MRTGYAPGALVVALGVVSHWVLDVVVHRPDMPLYPGGPKLGLGLWNSVTGTVVIEGVMLLAGLWIYLRTTRARDGVGRYGFPALLVVVTLSYVASIFGRHRPRRSRWASEGSCSDGCSCVGGVGGSPREAVYSS